MGRIIFFLVLIIVMAVAWAISRRRNSLSNEERVELEAFGKAEKARGKRSAKALGMKVVGMTGKIGSPLAALADVAIVTPGGRYADRVQELHIKCIHIIIELVERRLDPQNYED